MIVQPMMKTGEAKLTKIDIKDEKYGFSGDITDYLFAGMNGVKPKDGDYIFFSHGTADDDEHDTSYQYHLAILAHMEYGYFTSAEFIEGFDASGPVTDFNLYYDGNVMVVSSRFAHLRKESETVLYAE